MGRDTGVYKMHSGKWKFEVDKLNWFSDCQDKSREEDKETMAGRLHNGEKKLGEQEFQQKLFREYMHCPKAGCTVCPSKGPYAWAACASCSIQCFGKTQDNVYETLFWVIPVVLSPYLWWKERDRNPHNACFLFVLLFSNYLPVAGAFCLFLFWGCLHSMLFTVLLHLFCFNKCILQNFLVWETTKEF